MKKKRNSLQCSYDKTSNIDRIDYIIMCVMVLIYGVISFYRLGDLKAPNTYYTFHDDDDAITINFKNESHISKMLYFTGNNIGDILVMSSTDEKNYQILSNLKTNSVLSWEELEVDAKATSLKFIGKSYEVTLGDIVFLDNKGNRIDTISNKNNPLLDEIDLAPSNISYLNSAYFDEIYFARSAYEYVNGISVFEWTHPPLGKLIMAIPILLFGYSPFNARLMGNIAGILLIPIMYILSKKIFKNRKWAFLCALLMMFDNFHFAHTRIALVDGFQVLFIVLSVLFMKKYLDIDKKDCFKKKAINLLLSGFFIGCGIDIKWNTLYVGIGLAITFFVHLAKQYDFHLLTYLRNKDNLNKLINYLIFCLFVPFALYYLCFLFFGKIFSKSLFMGYISLLTIYLFVKLFKWLLKDKYLLKLFITCVISFIVIPCAIYILSYLLFPKVGYYDGTFKGIFDATKTMYNYHNTLDATHPFSSKWYQWLIMYKPVWLYSNSAINGMRMTIVDIGNPFIWWMGIIASLYLIISSFKKNVNSRFILVFLLSSLLPYILIGRIMFMYHFFITLPFVMLGIVGFIKWLTEKYNSKVYWIYACLVIVGFVVFYPVVSGINISEDYINALKWFSSWFF